jgi:dTDP-4-dehydrorhamnose reductase
MRIAVVGGGGQLGAAIVHEYSATGGHDIRSFTHAQLETTNDAAVIAALEGARPDLIINASAFNDVDGAEDRCVEALQVNAFAVRTMARVAERLNAVFVHYGSDFVFDGTATRPYTENEHPNPRSV